MMNGYRLLRVLLFGAVIVSNASSFSRSGGAGSGASWHRVGHPPGLLYEMKCWNTSEDDDLFVTLMDGTTSTSRFAIPASTAMDWNTSRFPLRFNKGMIELIDAPADLNCWFDYRPWQMEKE